MYKSRSGREATQTDKDWYKGSVNWKSAFKHAQNVQIHIILRMCKVLSPFLHQSYIL